MDLAKIKDNTLLNYHKAMQGFKKGRHVHWQCDIDADSRKAFQSSANLSATALNEQVSCQVFDPDLLRVEKRWRKKMIFPKKQREEWGFRELVLGPSPLQGPVSVSRRIKCVFALLLWGQNSFHTSSQLTKTQRFKPGWWLIFSPNLCKHTSTQCSWMFKC